MSPSPKIHFYRIELLGEEHFLHAARLHSDWASQAETLDCCQTEKVTSDVQLVNYNTKMLFLNLTSTLLCLRRTTPMWQIYQLAENYW
jgi:hypothetical protein